MGNVEIESESQREVVLYITGDAPVPERFAGWRADWADWDQETGEQRVWLVAPDELESDVTFAARVLERTGQALDAIPLGTPEDLQGGQIICRRTTRSAQQSSSGWRASGTGRT